MNTLYDFKLEHRFRAADGGDAHGNKTGKSSPPLRIRVPVGTVVFNEDSGQKEVDMVVDGFEYTICRGGKGGYGNLHYASSVRQAPSFAQRGAPSETFVARLELQLLADVGIIGLPNAGKSTLISSISAAKPKIADYPFTTIVPNLGVVSHRDETFVVADMPGLIEGAHEGVGLGHQFLRHIQRTRVLIHLIDCLPMDLSDPVENYEIVISELLNYDAALESRPTVVVLNKIDTLDEASITELVERFMGIGVHPLLISAATGKGVSELLDETVKQLHSAPVTVVMPTVVPLAKNSADEFWDVEPYEMGFKIVGTRIERLVAMTDFSSMEAIRYLHKRLVRIGVIERLRQAGAEEGDTITIGDYELAFSDRS